jgi:hypothetical protein
MTAARRTTSERVPFDPAEMLRRARAEAPPPEQILMQSLLQNLRRGRAPVEPKATDLEFVQAYRPRGEGGKRIQFEEWRHQVEMYEDDHLVQVLMCGAQTGKTARIFTRAVRLMLKYYGNLFGYYVPDQSLAGKFSDDRFRPFVLSMEEIAPYLGAATADLKGSDATMKKNIGASMLYFMSTRALTATEGVPLRGVFFDEVRRMDLGDIERAQERYSAQTHPVDVKVSTAGLTDGTIHTFFKRSDQRYFHTASDHPDGIVLSTTFPDCVMDLRHATPQLKDKVAHAFSHAGLPMCGMPDEQRERYPLACFYDPRTGHIITDPRDGWWEPHRPGAYAHGYQMPQMLSPMWTPGRMLLKYEEATDRAEFFNSALGLPFLDESQRLVSMTHLEACVNPQAVWAAKRSREWRARNMRNTAMGVDVQKGYLVAVVKQRTKNGKFATVHVEIAYEGGPKRVGPNPWRRLAQLMGEYDVRIAVIDAAPDFSGSQTFATAFRGRVWLASYSGGDSARLVSWGDANESPGKEARTDHSVSIHRTKGFQWSLGRWKRRANELPPPRDLWQELPVDASGDVHLSANLAGSWAPACTPALYMRHQTQIIIEDELKEDRDAQRQGKHKYVAVHIGDDPHFAHANLYADFALDRLINGIRRNDGEDDT